ncbi:MAG: T9SS type A sorting domain-containing protein [Bacteroidota bacterium]
MKILKLLFILSLSILSNDLIAQSGALDPTFDGDGIVTTNVSTTPSIDAGNAAVVQPDEKIVVVGDSTNRFTVVRYNTDGSFDTTFNTYGVSFPFQVSIGYAVALQSDGKIVAAGKSSGGLQLVRLNADGSFDNTFSTDGKIFIANFNGSIFVKSVVVASDGKILVAGYTGISPNRDFAVFRFNTDGTLDTTFDTDGIVTTAIGTGNDLANTMIIQSDNKILVAGQAIIAGNYDFALVRYNVDGSLDTAFGGTGKVTTPIGTNVDIIKAIDLQTDGKIVVSGHSVNSTINYIAVARYDTNGILDPGFDSDGKSIFIAGTSTALKVLSDGKILINSTVNTDYSVTRLNTDGSLDITFGSNGYTTHSIGADASNYLIVKTDDSIIIGGTSDNRITIIQFSANGNLINSFQSPEIGFENRFIETMAIQNDGKIVVAGESGSILLARYNVDGTFDASFGTNGLTTTNISTPSGNGITRLVLQNDGKIVIAKYGGYVARYTSNGVLDPTFGSNGITDLTAITGFIDNINISSTGKIYLAIDYQIASKTQFGLVRLNLDGSIDTTFGNSGIAYTSFNFYAPDDIEFPNNLIELSNGKVLVAGTLSSGSFTVGIVQFNSDGTLDNTFGTNGKVANPITNSDFAYDIVIQTDGKFIISHQISSCSGSCTMNVRYNSNGSIDTSYGTNGVVPDFFGSSQIFLQPDNKIIKGGSYSNHFAITRYNIDGSVDNTFGTNGIINTTIGNSSGIAKTALTPDGKLVAAGSSFNGYNNIFALARYTDLNLGNLDFTKSNKSIFIYPNPIEQETNLTYKLTQTTAVSIALYDMQGKLVKTYLQNATQNPDDYNQKIVMPNGLQTGNYVLKVSSPEGNVSIKLMKK